MCRDRLPWEWLDPKAPPSAAQPPCPSGFIEVPATDEDMILQTVALMEKYNMTGVLSAATRGGANPAERLDRLQKAAPGRFIPAV